MPMDKENSTEKTVVIRHDTQMSWPDPFLDIVYALAASKYLVILIVFFGVTIGIVRFLNLPSVYKASAVAILMPREKPMMDVAIDANSIESSEDRANRSTSGNLMLPPNPTLYTTLITSRGVIERIGERYRTELIGDLSPNDRTEEVYDTLRSMIKVNSTEEGLITITVTSENPKMSAEIANELFAECERASKAIERQLILQQVGPLEQAFINAEARLEESEGELERFAAQYGLVDLQLQAGNKLRSLRELSTQQDELHADLEELRMSYSENAPEIRRVKARINILDAQISSEEDSILKGVGENEYGGLSVSLESLQQKVQFERDLVLTLSTKVDVYHIRTEQPTGNIAVIRYAQVPMKPAGPSKKKELGLALFISMALAVSVAIAKWQWSLAVENRGVRNKLEQIRHRLVTLTPFSSLEVHVEPERLSLLMPPFNSLQSNQKETHS